MLVQAEIEGSRIVVRFPYDEDLVKRMRQVAGRRWSKATSSWSVPADWQSAIELRRAFGAFLTLGPGLREWGAREKVRQAKLVSLANATTAELEHLPGANPSLYEAIHLGPKGIGMSDEERTAALAGAPSFQAADVRFMVDSDNPLNANHMGLGKTIETIAAIEEAGLADGPILVVAPISAAEGTWPAELDRWQGRPYWLCRGSAKAKKAIQEEFNAWVSPQATPLRTPTGVDTIPGNAGYLIVNPAQLTMRETVDRCWQHREVNHKTIGGLKEIKQCQSTSHMAKERPWQDYPESCSYKIDAPYPLLFTIKWNAIVFDESHEFGVMSPKSLTGRGAAKLQLAERSKKILLSGTPMGGQPIRLFHILQFLNPKVFTSKWRFAEQYLEINDEGFGKSIGGIKRCEDHRLRGIRPGHGECPLCDEYERRMFGALNPYILRRTKDEVLTELPPKQHVDLRCPWGSPAHKKQYNKFAADSEAVVGDERISAVNVISEYTRLGQFAWGTWKSEGGELVPTEDSGKLQVLEGKLTELGIFDPNGEEQVVIFSQYRSIVNLVHAWLVKKGVASGKLTGDTNKRGERAELKDSFQAEGGLRALVVSTKAGGTSLTLDRASHVFILDETWNPDNQEQAEDRCHRASRIHQVTVYRLVTDSTIDEYRREVNWGKSAINQNVMDLRRIRVRGE